MTTETNTEGKAPSCIAWSHLDPADREALDRALVGLWNRAQGSKHGILLKVGNADEASAILTALMHVRPHWLPWTVRAEITAESDVRIVDWRPRDGQIAWRLFAQDFGKNPTSAVKCWLESG